MGIQGLLPQLKSIMTPIHVKDLKGQSVAVDTYSWLHKGALSCSRELCKGLPTSRHIDYCMHRVNLLRHYGVKPLLVFDGGLLPMKADQEAKRSRARKENLERAIEHESAGNSAAAYECYQKAVDISPSIASELIQVLKQENVDYIVAPYEADAQMTFLSLNNHVDVVITEDSDLIPFGCPRIIFKMDKFGQGVEFRSSMLARNKELSFFGFTKQMILEMCILSGCDYLQSLPGMGLKRAHALIQNFKSYEKVIKHLRYSTVSVPPLYEEAFKRALWTFLHQRVYDPQNEDIMHLTDIPDDVGDDYDFLGPWLPQDLVKGIAKGDLDPITKAPFKEVTCTALTNKVYPVREREQTREWKRLHLPVQKNILTNYFCLASIEAKRRFKAPQVMREQVVTTNRTSPKPEEHTSDTCSPEEREHLVMKDRISPSLEGNTSDTCLAEDTACTLNSSPGILAVSENSDDGILSDDFVADKFVNKKYQLMDSSSCGNLDCTEPTLSLLQSKIELSKPILASHKDHDSHSAVDVAKSNERLVNKRVILKRFDLHKKLPDENHYNSLTEVPMLKKQCSTGIVQDNSFSNDVSTGHNNLKITSKKRKNIHDHNPSVEEEVKSLKHANPDFLEKSENLNCDISHLKKYSGIAEESMKKFVSVISAFRYTPTGSRASGLRAPLKDVKNTSNRSAVAPVDISKFAYVPKTKKASTHN